ncbi:hypothetical protein D9M73_140850 [compost metagenome]
MGQQHLPAFGEGQPAGCADEQRQLLGVLQFAQRTGHGGLGDPQRTRGATDAAGFGAGDQRLQLMQFHRNTQVTTNGCQHNQTAAPRLPPAFLRSPRNSRRQVRRRMERPEENDNEYRRRPAAGRGNPRGNGRDPPGHPRASGTRLRGTQHQCAGGALPGGVGLPGDPRHRRNRRGGHAGERCRPGAGAARGNGCAADPRGHRPALCQPHRRRHACLRP